MVGTCELWKPRVVGYAGRAGHKAFTNKSSGIGEVPVKQEYQVGSN